MIVPLCGFEFITEQDSARLRRDPSYRPRTLLLDEVKAGENYELVITNFLGGALVRYRTGDMVKITSRRNDQLDIDIPQMEYFSRVEDIVSIGDSVRLSENIIWRAIEKSGVAYRDWTAWAEVRGAPGLHIYLELKEGDWPRKKDIAGDIHYRLKETDEGYAGLELSNGLMPLEVTLLPANTFRDFRLSQQVSGVDPSHLKMSHVNPSQIMLDFLVKGSSRPSVPDRKEQRPEPVHSR